MKSAILIAWIIFTITSLSSCVKEQNSIYEQPQTEIVTIFDTVELVFQNFAGESFQNKFDTQLVFIETSNELRKISRLNTKSDSLSSIEISRKMNRFYITRVPKPQNSVCQINKTDSTLTELGIVLIGNCHHQSGKNPTIDTGVKLMYSTKWGQIVSKGLFCQCGSLLYAINGKEIPIENRLRLLKMIN